MTTCFSLVQKIPLDFRACLVIFLASAFLFIDARGLPDKAVLFPSIMLVAAMLLSAYCMARSLMKQRKIAREETGLLREKTAKPPVDRAAVCIFGGMVAVYALLTPFIGFGLASLIFIGAGTVFFGERDKRAFTLIPLATMAFVYGFFIWFLDVSIPFFPAVFGS